MDIISNKGQELGYEGGKPSYVIQNAWSKDWISADEQVTLKREGFRLTIAGATLFDIVEEWLAKEMSPVTNTQVGAKP